MLHIMKNCNEITKKITLFNLISLYNCYFVAPLIKQIHVFYSCFLLRNFLLSLLFFNRLFKNIGFIYVFSVTFFSFHHSLSISGKSFRAKTQLIFRKLVIIRWMARDVIRDCRWIYSYTNGQWRLFRS